MNVVLQELTTTHTFFCRARRQSIIPKVTYENVVDVVRSFGLTPAMCIHFSEEHWVTLNPKGSSRSQGGLSRNGLGQGVFKQMMKQQQGACSKCGKVFRWRRPPKSQASTSIISSIGIPDCTLYTPAGCIMRPFEIMITEFRKWESIFMRDTEPTTALPKDAVFEKYTFAAAAAAVVGSGGAGAEGAGTRILRTMDSTATLTLACPILRLLTGFQNSIMIFYSLHSLIKEE